MRLPKWITVASISLFTRYTLAHISLTELQPISGFSDACTQVYDTPLTDCALSDFYQGNICSSGCIAFLQDLTARLNEECEGVTAYPNTLIGMFFERTAIQRLCGGTQGATDSVVIAGPVESTTVESTSATSSRFSSSTTSTVVETATMTATSTTSTAVPSTASSTLTSVVPSSTANAGQGSDVGSLTAASSTTGPSDTQRSPTGTDANRGSGGGGNNDGTGGTVLEAASTGNVKSIQCLLSCIACLTLVMWTL
ncbi:MAG: hypothetical protein LQ339_001830 [Xanthoria mediterranea]|nr:MAG: hypothetical protein LQ339_001830 [Xanthoria mediterranea]